MAVIEDMVGRQSPLELGIGDMRKEEVFLILPAQNRGKTSDRFPWVGCTGSGEAWETVVCEQFLGSSCIAGCSPVLVVGSLRAFGVVMQMMIRPVSRDLQDVS